MHRRCFDLQILRSGGSTDCGHTRLEGEMKLELGCLGSNGSTISPRIV